MAGRGPEVEALGCSIDGENHNDGVMPEPRAAAPQAKAELCPNSSRHGLGHPEFRDSVVCVGVLVSIVNEHVNNSYNSITCSDDVCTDLFSWDSEESVSETQFGTSEIGEVSNEDECVSGPGLADARRTQGCNTDHSEGWGTRAC